MPIFWFVHKTFKYLLIWVKKLSQLMKKHLLTTFWTRRVKMCITAQLVAMTTCFQPFCSDWCQFFDLYKKLSRNCWLSWRNCRSSWKNLVITFKTRRVIMCITAHLIAVVTYCWRLCSNRCKSSDLYKKITKILWFRWRNCRTSWKTFVNNF